MQNHAAENKNQVIANQAVNQWVNPLLAKIAEIESKEVADFIAETIGTSNIQCALVKKGEGVDFQKIPHGNPVVLINLNTINYQVNFETHFKLLTQQLPLTAIFISCIENISARKQRFRHRYNPFQLKAVWFFDFLWHRIAAKVMPTKKLYHYLTKGNYQVISRAETLGRLHYNGFELINFREINNKFYFSTIKSKEALTERPPSAGFLIRLKRIGKGGKIINVYKVRSMHAYSEYLQEYLVKLNGYNAYGKPQNDFRLANWAILFRKLHIDELPQLINVLKGELDLVGVRPISRFGYKSLPPDLQEKRIKYKPGCIPPNKALG